MTVVDLRAAARARAGVARAAARTGAGARATTRRCPSRSCWRSRTSPRRRTASASCWPGTGTELVGCAVLSPARDGSTVVHVVVDPAVAGAAARRSTPALAAAGRARRRPARPRSTSGSCRPRAADDARVRPPRASSPSATCSRCASPSRCPTTWSRRPGPWRPGPSSPAATRRPWVETNNRAFAGHPEQGAWTVAELQRAHGGRLGRPRRLPVADDPDGPGLIGACWTKVHRDRTPVLGEIYVIDVDPRHHGQGWGRSLTVAGLVAPGRAAASRSACSTPTPPTWPRWRSTARSASRSTTSTAPTGRDPDRLTAPADPAG